MTIDLRGFLILVMALATVSISGCAGAALKSEMENKRGYSKDDMQAIMGQMDEYKRRLIAGGMASNALNSAPRQAEEAKLVTVWCNCWKRLKDRCREKSDGLSGDDKALWVKSNAVEMAFASQETALDAKPATHLDGAECP